MEKGMMKRPGVFRVLPTSLQKSISQGCGIVCARPSGWDNCFLSSSLKESYDSFMRKQNDLFDHNAALEMANCRVSKSHKECGVRSIPLFLLFFFFPHAEIGQFGHFCFPQINQNSFCPLNSSQLLLKEANLASS